MKKQSHFLDFDLDLLEGHTNLNIKKIFTVSPKIILNDVDFV